MVKSRLKKVQNSRHVNRQFSRVIFVTFRDAISERFIKWIHVYQMYFAH